LEERRKGGKGGGGEEIDGVVVWVYRVVVELGRFGGDIAGVC
jgi:hypothetical protein